ncbi:hypothetical protein SODALDRAFT_324725 [Sodiomyces alkalinus F11]|uniref:TMEM1 family protein n=1 Tax=Sodiomyces alkalinus (strain CBS 110278 / VKM F-3762 / F11) TaxID=1314773 RepID=A0A3N2PRB5_SODAK|nr:hypothetical protein SODALDRAFT_324725 [Sodiomyces alkalinus F11]ROT37053.1 hypothetical protein SODALDRAFT_324725 [Sodiomyces alkalinus F11]
MEQPFSTSKVTVEYYDPHDVYKLLGPGILPRLPLRNLHWQSHAGPLRSIDVLYVELVNASSNAPASIASPSLLRRSTGAGLSDDGFQTQPIGGSKSASSDQIDTPTSIHTPTGPASQQPGRERRHQIPGLRRTPYLKVLLVRCDDNDTYKSTTRAEIREWIKEHTPPSQSTRKVSTQENHDAFEWLIVHVVVPNTAAANQPRLNGKNADGAPGEKSSSSSRWRTGSSTLLEKLRADFNVAGKGSGPVDRVAQIRIGINDVPYDLLPRVVPATPTGYSESEKDAEHAWDELIAKFKSLILASFDMRVTQYEEDIREKDAQRRLPGWNFCTFFILKEGLARGFESVGLVEDALVGYDELSVGLDSVIHEQVALGEPERHGSSLLSHTEELKQKVARALASATGGGAAPVEDEEAVDLQGESKIKDVAPSLDSTLDEFLISSTRKPYRDMIVANNVSVFDFRCYIFARQIALLLRLGNSLSAKTELVTGPQQQVPALKPSEETEVLSMLAEVCRRTLQFIPAISQIMRSDLVASLGGGRGGDNGTQSTLSLNPVAPEVVDNLVSSFAFSVAQQILAQTSTQALPIPASSLISPKIDEPKSSIPEPKTMMHPARSSSLHIRPSSRPPPSPGVFPGPGAGSGAGVSETSAPAPAPPAAAAAAAPRGQFLKSGLEELAARRAELYALSRSILEECGKKRGWGNGWASVPDVEESDIEEMDMEDISLDDDDESTTTTSTTTTTTATTKPQAVEPSLAGVESRFLRVALDNKDDFYRLFETLTDKAIRHYTVADHHHAVQACLTELAILKYHLGDYGSAASYFHRTTPFFGENGWSALELSMLVMYSRCLQELQRKDDYVRVALKLLSKAAVAQKDRLSRKKLRGFVPSSHRQEGQSREQQQQLPNPDDAVRGVLDKLIDVTKAFSHEVPIPLAQFFSDVRLEGHPEYDLRRDGFTLAVSMQSLLADDMEIDQGRMRLVSTTATAGATKELWLECATAQVLRPGRNTIRLYSKTCVAGRYEVDRVSLISNKIHMHYERDIDSESGVGVTSDLFPLPHVTIYRPAGCLDCQLVATKDIQLDRSNTLDLKLHTGWNRVKSCDIRVRPNTGGLRLLTMDAQFIGPAFEFAQPPEAGLFRFGSLSAETALQLRFPYSTEQDVATISARVEVTYTTDDGTYSSWAGPSIPISLALGVNVQDIFKHGAVFSRFSISTVSPSPLLLFKSELRESEVFQSHFGSAPDKTIMVFPKQPASLLYKVVRKPGVTVNSKTAKTLYLKLHYSVVLDEMVVATEKSLKEAAVSADLAPFTNVLATHVRKHLPARLTAYDLERAALLGQFPTTALVGTHLEASFAGLGKVPGSERDASAALAALIRDWQRRNPTLPLLHPPAADVEETPSILIPVDVPSVPVHWTVDIQLQKPLFSPLLPDGAATSSATPVVGINQLLSASLTVQWTRTWHTAAQGQAQAPESTATRQEFSYEVTTPADTWLLGGRKRGRMTVPAEEDTCTMEIPLLMAPLREGWLPYPSVEIREAKSDEQGTAGSQGPIELDYRNLGETVRVVADRERVTLSLDSSGPGGGPLVLESERRVVDGRVVV